MTTITLVTGNKAKLAAWQRMIPPDFTLESVDVDLEEIQSMDLMAVATDKARRAYEKVKRPVIIEDVAAGLDDLNGLPGPFIKFFEQQLGKDALYKLAGSTAPATVLCAAVFYDGTQTLLGNGIIHGTVVEARGENGFGFDFVFQPDGYTKTFAEMTFEEKDAISHRQQAIKSLVAQLRKIN